MDTCNVFVLYGLVFETKSPCSSNWPGMLDQAALDILNSNLLDQLYGMSFGNLEF